VKRKDRPPIPLGVHQEAAHLAEGGAHGEVNRGLAGILMRELVRLLILHLRST